MLNKIYLPKRAARQLDKEEDIYFHAMSLLLENADLQMKSLMELMYNTRYYLKYDLLENISELSTVDSYQLLSHGLGLYYEEFSFRDIGNFKKYLLRNLKMKISTPLVKLNSSVLEIDATDNVHFFVLCVDYNEEND